MKKGDRECSAFHVREALTMYLQTMNLIGKNETVSSLSPDTNGEAYRFRVEKDD